MQMDTERAEVAHLITDPIILPRIFSFYIFIAIFKLMNRRSQTSMMQLFTKIVRTVVHL